MKNFQEMTRTDLAEACLDGEGKLLPAEKLDPLVMKALPVEPTPEAVAHLKDLVAKTVAGTLKPEEFGPAVGAAPKAEKDKPAKPPYIGDQPSQVNAAKLLNGLTLAKFKAKPPVATTTTRASTPTEGDT